MKREIPDNLTFEQFKALADRKPSMEGNWIYRLTHETVRGNYEFPEFRIYQIRYMFMSLTEAEKFMREVLIPDIERYNTYRFLIEQVPVGKNEYRIGASWVYDKDGKLIVTASTICEGEYPDATFFGRSKEKICFSEGDIVEIVDDDIVHLAIIGAEGQTVEWFWGLYQRSMIERNKEGKGYYGAYWSDDCYYVVDSPDSQTHPHVTNVMKPRFPIPQDIREYFEKCLVMSKKREVVYSPFRLTMESANMFDVAEIEIKLRYDSNEKRHRLSLRTTDNVTDSESERVLSQDFSDNELRHISEWLNYKKYGKTRLWYLIQEWNEYFSSDKRPALSPDIPLEELLK